MKSLLMGDEGAIEGDFDTIEVARSPTQWAAINLRPSHSHIRVSNANQTIEEKSLFHYGGAMNDPDLSTLHDRS